MPDTASSISVNASDDLLTRTEQRNDARAPQGVRGATQDDSAGAVRKSSGILPSQELEHLVRGTREIRALEPIQADQYQPASLDLRLGSVAYRVRASFLPGKTATVEKKLEDLEMHKMDISDGGVLERGCVYIVPLLEGWR